MLAPIPRQFLLAAGLAVAAMPRSGHAAAPSPASWRGDARFLVAAIDSLHPRPHYLYKSAALDSAAADLDQRLPALRYDQAVAAFSRILAMLGDGHSRLDQLSLSNHTRPTLAPLPGPGFDTAYPVEFEIFADGLRIVRATSPHVDLLGAHVAALNGHALPDVVAALTPIVPHDNSMWVLYLLPVFLRSPGYLSAASLASEPTAPLRLTVTDSRGRKREVSLAAERPDSSSTWIAADAGVRAPLPLYPALTERYGLATLDDRARTVYARIHEIVDERGHETMAQFVKRLFARVDSLGSRRLILDLRGNGGGNGYLNQPLVHAVIRHPAIDRAGGLFVITDRGTFSAAGQLCADLQRETHPLFVGEPTGGAPNQPGDPAHVALPASGLVVRISTVQWNGSDPRDPREFIAPDLPAMASYKDWLDRRDPAMDAIRAYLPPDSIPDVPPNQHWGARAQIDARPPAIKW